jgi:hypothetical protein
LKPRLKASLSPETRRELGQVTNQATADRVNRSESVRAARELATVAAGAIGAGEDPPANPALQEESLAAVTEGLSMLPDNRWEVWLFTKPAPNWSGGCHGRSYFTDAAAIGQHYRGACELGPGRIVTAAEEARWTGDPKRVYLLNGLYIEIRYLAPPRIAA